MGHNDKKILATNLGLTVEKFDELLTGANRAYETIKNLGPFYGQEHISEPTFRITAEPVILPKNLERTLTQLGEDILFLGRALPKVPDSYKSLLGEDLDFKLPPTWRVDAILDENGHFRINEIEGIDGATALMMAEQLAHGLQNLEDSTAAHLILIFKKMYPNKNKIRIALMIRSDFPHKPNTVRFIKFLQEISAYSIEVDLYEDGQLRSNEVQVDWKKYDGIINESTIFPKELESFGVQKGQIISSGNYNAITNKGVFAILFEKVLQDFWKKEIGAERLQRIQNVIAYTKFVRKEEDLKKARVEGRVVKVYWSGGEADRPIINRSKGVAMPEGTMGQASQERWQYIQELFHQNFKIISQKYIRPGKFKAHLRKKGTNLEPVEWYNRICVKYVCDGDPNKSTTQSVKLTAIEVTLGPEIIAAGRACAFTAGKFAKETLPIKFSLRREIASYFNRPSISI